MAKPNKADKADRRAVVEQMRREQKAKERRKSLLVLAAAVSVGAIIIGAAVWQVLKADDGSAALANVGVAASAAGCQEVVTKDAEGNNDHRPDGEAILYESSPPAAGPHWGSFLLPTEIRKLYSVDDRPAVGKLVHSLEHGHTILWYDETIADDEQAMDELESIADQFPSTTNPAHKFIAAPWTSEDGEPFPDDAHVALTHWSMGGTNGNPEGQQGVWQYCSEVSGEVVDEFMADYPSTDSPEPTSP